MEEQTYGPAEVCAALGLRRDVLHGWAARKLLDFAGPAHPGIARRFTVLDVIKIGAMVNMTVMGIGIGQAAAYAQGIDRLPKGGEYLLVTCDPPGRTVLAGMTAVGLIADLADVAEFTKRLHSLDNSGASIIHPGIYLLDLAELCRQVRQGLEDPSWRPDLSSVDGRPDALTIAVLKEGDQDDSSEKTKAPRRGRRKAPR